MNYRKTIITQRIKRFSFLALACSLFFVGCDFLSPSAEQLAPARATLAIYINGAIPTDRTALPTVDVSTYVIRVTRNGESLGEGGSGSDSPASVPGQRDPLDSASDGSGSDNPASVPGQRDPLDSASDGSGSDTEGSLFLLQLRDSPAVGDVVAVEGFNGAVKTAEGSETLTSSHIAGDPVVINLHFLSEGTGNVDLNVSFPSSFSGDDEITAAEVSLYRSLADYQEDSVYQFTRYRKDDTYGAGEDFAGTSMPIQFYDLPAGNYVVKIAFFRLKYVRVSLLVQTVIVRAGLTTNTWDNFGGSLDWIEGNFASSNANLKGISIGDTLVSGFSSDIYTYSVYETTLNAPQDKSLSVTVTPDAPGQSVTASLNEAEVSLTRNGGVLTGSLTSLQGANSLVITVTAPDGVTKQTYTVSYTYIYTTEWHVSQDGDDGDSGTSQKPLATVGKALALIKIAYDSGSGWPGGTSNPIAARINIHGTIVEDVTIGDSSLPPILLMGSGTAEINAASERALTIKSGTKAILGDDLTLVRNENTAANNGGGVFVESGGDFTMNGGSVSRNSASLGGGVFVESNSAFTMNGGSVSENSTINGDGGGVFVESGGAFTMNGGSVSGNSAADGSGGGVFVNGGAFTMNGGSVSGNSATYNGGGVFVESDGAFTMTGGSVSGNSSTNGDGGGVFVNGGAFTMNGGSVSGNSAASNGGGGVFVESGGDFTMNGGSVSRNSASLGGGVF
ncbi:MAG: cadherin-like beta sandwich domain-containing protein, partial [Treponema sp.]|nr:cadherin-like beta sandwich domain-containing protein [Treponema sp.]